MSLGFHRRLSTNGERVDAARVVTGRRGEGEDGGGETHLFCVSPRPTQAVPCSVSLTARGWGLSAAAPAAAGNE
ncbi:MAG: hypothetical protein ACKESB_02410 [Candidatus Hodgkinia cicadicola]